MANVFIAIGSNVGDRYKNIMVAKQLLAEKMKIKGISPIYETSPYGYEEQPYFLNCVVRCETDLSPWLLLKELKRIENIIGRRKRKKWGPREIDLDILFYDDLTIDSKRLAIPHPQIPYRKFFLKPLSNLAPHFVHPTLNKTVKQILNDLNDRTQKIRVFKKNG